MAFSQPTFQAVQGQRICNSVPDALLSAAALKSASALCPCAGIPLYQHS